MRTSSIWALVLNLALAGGAAAQTTTTTPDTSRGAPAVGDPRGLPQTEEGLDLVLRTFGGYDDDVLADQGSQTPNQRTLTSAAGGFVSSVGAALSFSRPGLLYARPGAEGAFRAWADSSIRYYPGLDNLTGTYQRAGMQVSFPVNRRLTFYASPQLDYSPRYSFSLFPDPLDTDRQADAPPPDLREGSPAELEYSVVEDNSFRYGGIGGANIVLGAHSALAFDYGYDKRMSDVREFDMAVQRAGVSVDRQFTRTTTVELEYSYQESDQGEFPTSQAHTANVGIEYSKPLSHIRRSLLRLDVGSTVADSPLTGQHVHAIGSASVVHHLSSGWIAVAQYRRRLQYVEGFDRPILSNALSTGLNGLLTRRMDLGLRVSYLSGAVGITPEAPRFGSYTASIRLRRALTRTLAGYAEGLYYHYRFDENAIRPPGLPQTFDRIGIRFGLNLWIPLLDGSHAAR